MCNDAMIESSALANNLTWFQSYASVNIHTHIVIPTYVTGPAKINHVSANYTELYFFQYLQL